jgi:hypothetical protein
VLEFAFEREDFFPSCFPGLIKCSCGLSPHFVAYRPWERDLNFSSLEKLSLF